MMSVFPCQFAWARWLCRLALAGVWLFGLPSAFAQVRITEVLAEDRFGLADEEGEHSGWIELHNRGAAAVSLAGFGLSDDPGRPFRWTFPDVSLAPAGRLVVFASGKDRQPAGHGTDSGSAELRPSAVGGLRWWVDAADAASLGLAGDRVREWQDRGGHSPADEFPAPLPPSDLPGKVLWLDAADPASVDIEEARVREWRDRSGAGRHATQPAVSRRPVWRAGTNVLQRLEFDGQDDALQFPGEVRVRTLVWVGVESPWVLSGDFRPLVGHASRFDFLRGRERRLLGDHVGMAAGVRNAAVYLNGVRVNPATTVLPPGLNVVIIACTDTAVFDNLADDRGLPGGRWWGEVAELVGFEQALAETEILGLDRHLRAKWQGVPDRVAADHSARQGHPAWQPLRVHDPLTGLPAVRFDGVDDRLRFAEVKRVQSVFMVVREHEHATDATRPFLGHAFSTALARGYDRLLLQVGSPRAWIDAVAVDPLVVRPPARRFLLGIELPEPVPVDSLAQDATYDDLLFEGDVHEVALFDRPLSEAERAGLNAYFSRKWQLPDQRWHANFSLKSEGEPVLLTAPDGRLADAVPARPAWPDHPYGRVDDGDVWGWLTQATPGQPNSGPAVELGLTPPPLVSPPAGFLRENQPVELQAATHSPAGTRIYYTLDGAEPVAQPETPWLEDGLPAGAGWQTINDGDWSWVRTEPVPVSGGRALRSGTVAGVHQAVVTFAEPRPVAAAAQIHFELWCDPAQPPRTVMLQLRAGGTWDHRAFWGDDLIEFGQPATAGRRRIGDLPPPGRWVRLSFPATLVGLTNSAVSALALTLFDGRAAVDALGSLAVPLPRIYEGPLALADSTVVRARAVAPGHLPSAVVTASFLARPPGGLPVVSLSTAPAHLFDESVGLYAPGPELGLDGQPRRPNYLRDWERPVHAEFFEPDGNRGFAVDCGLKIHGAFSRHWPQRSLRLHFRRRYGPGTLAYPVFPGHPVSEFDSLVLRNGGNDWNFAYLRDDLAHGLAADLGLDHQASRPAHLFLNGAYWGVQFLREQADPGTIARQNALAEEDLDVVKNELEVVAGDRSDYDAMVHTAINATLDPEFQPRLVARVNVADYWDWLGLELFSGNVDWPGNNMLAWRVRRPDARWHWMLLDCDGGFFPLTLFDNSLKSMLQDRPLAGLPGQSLAVMRGLVNHEAYRRDLARRLGDLLNTTFSPAHTLARLDQLESVLAPAMPAQIARWKDSASPAMPPGAALQTMDEWREEVAQAREFLRQRPVEFREHVRQFFGLGADCLLTFDASPAEHLERLQVATLGRASGQLPWRAAYFGGLPVEVRVEPRPGYRVIGWSDGAPATALRVLVPEQDRTLTVLLGPDGDGGPAPFPAPHPLRTGDYQFADWPAAAAPNTYPPSMSLETTATADPTLAAAVTGRWTNRYDLDSRSRILGAEAQGLAFVNTGNSQTGADYVAGALLALDTTGVTAVAVTWTGGTVLAHTRPYGLRLQWRVGSAGPFADVLTATGEPVEYLRQPVDGHAAVLGPVRLPAAATGQPLVQLRWRYHAIPAPGESGPRAQLRLDDIRVTGQPAAQPPRSEVTLSGDSLVIAVSALPGTACVLRVSDDLRVWNDLVTGTVPAAGRLNFSVSISGPRQFYQLHFP